LTPTLREAEVFVDGGEDVVVAACVPGFAGESVEPEGDDQAVFGIGEGGDRLASAMAVACR